MEVKQPKGWRNWDRFQPPRVVLKNERTGETMEGSRHLAYKRGRLLVLSSFDVLEFRGERRPQYLISVSDGALDGSRRRATNEQVAMVLRDFDMEGAEEDNHGSGVARKFFKLADPRPGEEGAQCECKGDETTVVEPDGYTWQRGADGDAYAGIVGRPPEGWAGRKL